VRTLTHVALVKKRHGRRTERAVAAAVIASRTRRT
jgi:hypothetical protein